MKKFKKSKKRLQEGQYRPKEEQKKLSKTFWMGVFIAAIMILSVIGYVWNGGNDTDFEYNGFSLILTEDGLWTMDYNGQNIMFYNHPTEVEYLKIDTDTSNALKNAKMIYATSDPDDLLKEAIGGAEFEIKREIEKKGIYFIYSFTDANEFNRTIMTCDNATPSVPVLYFTHGNTTNISSSNNCIISQADSAFGIRKLRDRLLYAFLGVIE